MAGTTRQQDGNTRRGNTTTSQHVERTRGRCNGRTTRDYDATTSLRDEMTRGRHNETTRGRRVERLCNNLSAQATRGQEGGKGRNKRTRRGDATISWCTTSWREDGAMRGRREAMQQPAGTTRQWEGGATRGR
jgi:hypothetical protein